MKKNWKKYFVALFGLTMVLILCCWFFWQKAPQESESTKQPAFPESEVNVASRPNASSESLTAQQSPSTSQAKPVQIGNPDHSEQIQTAASLMNVPINFWGKVVDQDEKPLSGVKVTMEVRRWHSKLARPIPENVNYERESSSDGYFELRDSEGDVLAVKSLEKTGYQASPNTRQNFGYNISSNITPDPNNPIVFKMWKKVGAEPLLLGNQFFGVIPDGRVYTINLFTNTKTESPNAEGDIRVKISRPAGVTRGDKYDWSFSIEPINGGILETTDEFMNLAPEQNYAPEFIFEAKASEPKWSRRIKKKFFIKTRSNLFGKIEVDVFAFYDNEAVFSFKSAINPSGSRNLEYDEAVQPQQTVFE